MRALNPVLSRELTERWRGRRAFAVITAYVAVLAGIVQLLYWVGERTIDDQVRFGGFDPIVAGPSMGRFLFENLVAFVLLLVLFVAPGYAAAQISGERERGTLRLLQATLLRPIGIVIGKLGASIAWLVLLVLAAVPFGAAAFFLGGVTAADLLRAVATILVVAVGVAAIGIGISSYCQRTSAAVVLTYGTVMFLVLGTFVLAGVESVVTRDDFSPPRTARAMYLNPFFGLADAARADQSRYGWFGGSLPSALGPFADQLLRDQQFQVFEERGVVNFFGGEHVRGMDVVVDGPDGAIANLVDLGQVEPMPPGGPGFPGTDPFASGAARPAVWLRVMGVYSALGVLGLAVATVRVRPNEGRRRFRRRPKAASPAQAVVLDDIALELDDPIPASDGRGQE